MAKAKAICRCKTCGAEFEAASQRPNRADADNWERWATDHLDECQDCRQKRIEAERQEESRKAAEAARELNLPPLAGTERQTAWAESIRIGFVRTWDGFIDALRGQGGKGVSTAERFRAWILSRNDARFWIDHRLELDMPPRMIWKAFKADYQARAQEGETEA